MCGCVYKWSGCANVSVYIWVCLCERVYVCASVSVCMYVWKLLIIDFVPLAKILITRFAVILTLGNELVHGCACKYVYAYVNIKANYKYCKPVDMYKTFMRKLLNFLYVRMYVCEGKNWHIPRGRDAQSWWRTAAVWYVLLVYVWSGRDGGRKVEKEGAAYLYMWWIIAPHSHFSILLTHTPLRPHSQSSHSHLIPFIHYCHNRSPSLSFISVSPSFSFISLTFHLCHPYQSHLYSSILHLLIPLILCTFIHLFNTTHIQVDEWKRTDRQMRRQIDSKVCICTKIR